MPVDALCGASGCDGQVPRLNDARAGDVVARSSARFLRISFFMAKDHNQQKHRAGRVPPLARTLAYGRQIWPLIERNETAFVPGVFDLHMFVIGPPDNLCARLQPGSIPFRKADSRVLAWVGGINPAGDGIYFQLRLMLHMAKIDRRMASPDGAHDESSHTAHGLSTCASFSVATVRSRSI